MSKEILSEINRFREILGLSLLKEAPAGPGKWFISSSDDITGTLSKTNDEFANALDDISTISSKSVDEISDPFLKEFKKSIDEISTSQGKSIDEILQNPRLREMVQLKFANKVKNNSDLVSKMVDSFYTKNPAAKQLVNPKNISASIENAVSKGIKDYDALVTAYNKTIDEFETASGDKIPDVIKKEMKEKVKNEVETLKTKKPLEKQLEKEMERDKDLIVTNAKAKAKTEGKVLPDQKLLADNAMKMLRENKTQKEIEDYLAKQFGIPAEEYRNGFQRFMSKYVGSPFNTAFTWVTEQGGNLIKFYGDSGKGNKRLWATLSLPLVGAALYGVYLAYGEYTEVEDIDKYEDKLAGFNDLPKEVKEWVAVNYPYLAYRDPKNVSTNQYLKDVTYKEDVSDPDFPKYSIIVTFGDGTNKEVTSKDKEFWEAAVKTQEQIAAEKKAAEEAAKNNNQGQKTLDDFKKSDKGAGYESTSIEVSPGKFKRKPESMTTYTWDGTKFVGTPD